jgi:hypothetical protein
MLVEAEPVKPKSKSYFARWWGTSKKKQEEEKYD